MRSGWWLTLRVAMACMLLGGCRSGVVMARLVRAASNVLLTTS